jgi:protein-S-isoprenylcysteine O-methyltransferase Ste14
MNAIIRRIAQLLVLVLLQAALLFACSGSLCWLVAWWYLGLYLLCLALASFLLLPRHRAVVEERSKGIKGGKPWDRLLTRLMALPTLGLLAVAGLDERWQWSGGFPLWLRLLGTVLFAGGYALVVWAMSANQFFSQIVRVQAERGHYAISGGPYRFVRHPGYLGMALSCLGSVFLLDSVWSLTCFLGYLVLLVTRTAWEDRTLRAELPGYANYAARTRYRLLPGLW